MKNQILINGIYNEDDFEDDDNDDDDFEEAKR